MFKNLNINSYIGNAYKIFNFILRRQQTTLMKIIYAEPRDDYI